MSEQFSFNLFLVFDSFLWTSMLFVVAVVFVHGGRRWRDGRHPPVEQSALYGSARSRSTHRNISSDSEDQLVWIKGAVHSENKLCQYKLHRVKIQPLLSHDALQTARHHGVSLNSLKATVHQKVFFICDREHLAAASSRLQFSTFL